MDWGPGPSVQHRLGQELGRGWSGCLGDGQNSKILSLKIWWYSNRLDNKQEIFKYWEHEQAGKLSWMQETERFLFTFYMIHQI